MMITITEKTVITKEKHLITVDIGENVPEGEYLVEIILNQINERPKNLFTLRSSNYAFGSQLTFSREDMYGENGR